MPLYVIRLLFVGSARQPAKTGGAGNIAWYTPSVVAAATATAGSTSRRFAAAASARPASAGGQYQQQQQPIEPLSPIAAKYYAEQAATQGAPLDYVPPTRSLPAPSFPSASATAAASASSTRPYDPSYSSRRRSDAAAASIPWAEEHADDCICTVCNCGKHHCPPTPRSNHYDPSMMTENHASYRGKFVPAERAGRPDTFKPRTGVVFDAISTHKADYLPHRNAVPRKSFPKSVLMDTGVGKSSVPFDDTTTHKSDFPAHPLFPGQNESFAPKSTLKWGETDDRDWSTEGHNAFPVHPLQKRREKQLEAPKGSIPFQGQTTHQSDYLSFPGARPSIPKQRMSGFTNLSNPEDRDFVTEHRGTYVRRQKVEQDCPAIPVAQNSKLASGHIKVELNPHTKRYQRKQYF